MSWPDESFDLVWACESGEHMPDKKKYVEEMVRVLKPGMTLPSLKSLRLPVKFFVYIYIMFSIFKYYQCVGIPAFAYPH